MVEGYYFRTGQYNINWRMLRWNRLASIHSIFTLSIKQCSYSWINFIFWAFPICSICIKAIIIFGLLPWASWRSSREIRTSKLMPSVEWGFTPSSIASPINAKVGSLSTSSLSIRSISTTYFLTISTKRKTWRAPTLLSRKILVMEVLKCLRMENLWRSFWLQPSWRAKIGNRLSKRISWTWSSAFNPKNGKWGRLGYWFYASQISPKSRLMLFPYAFWKEQRDHLERYSPLWNRYLIFKESTFLLT